MSTNSLIVASIYFQMMRSSNQHGFMGSSRAGKHGFGKGERKLEVIAMSQCTLA